MKRAKLIAAGMLAAVVLGGASEAAGHYHPRLGRFCQRDPVGYADGMSLYEYVGGGPVSRRDPDGTWTLQVHKDLARRAGGFLFRREGEQFLKCLEEGAVWPDIPEGAAEVASIWWQRKTAHVPEETRKGLTYRSHWGDLQYWHGMQAPGLPVGITVERITDWIVGQCEKAKKECGCRRAKEIGKALHTIQDLWAPAHVMRDWDKDPTGFRSTILRFQNYAEQDEAKHEEADKISDAEKKGDGLKARAWRAARKSSWRFLVKMKRGNCEGLRRWLTGDGFYAPLKIDDIRTLPGGTDPEYARGGP